MKTKVYGEFWQKIHNSAKRRGVPLRVMFELTYRCNFKCKHCYVPDNYKNRGEINTQEVFSIIDQLKKIGTFYLGFTGGEPFMRDDILDILWYAKKSGFEVIVYTNGSLIDEKTAEELGRMRLNKIDITIPGMSKDVFEGVTCLSGSRDRVFNAIDLLCKNNVNLGFKTCLLKQNEKEIKEIENFAHSLGALHRLDTMLSARLDGDAKPYLYRGGEFSRGAGKKLPKSESCNQAITLNLFKCGVGLSQAAITPQGELKPCLMIDTPRFKILDTNLKHAWQKLKDFIKQIKPDENYKCNTCELADVCKWCPARAWLYDRTFTSCAPENRARAEKLKEQYA
jgi:radical SAM protein with 4Fe4S-binding SPASM domain